MSLTWSWGTPGSQVSVGSYVHCLHRQGNFWPRRKRPLGLNYCMCAAQLRDPDAAELPLVVSWAYKEEPTACETKLLRGDIRETKLSLKAKMPFSAVPQLTPENLFQMHLYWKRENTPASVELKEAKQVGDPHLQVLVPKRSTSQGWDLSGGSGLNQKFMCSESNPTLTHFWTPCPNKLNALFHCTPT